MAATVCWKGPDVLLLGWVPYFQDETALPAGHGFSNGLAARFLFQCGNPDPPLSFGTYKGFTNWRHSATNPVGARSTESRFF